MDWHCIRHISQFTDDMGLKPPNFYGNGMNFKDSFKKFTSQHLY